MEQDSKLYKYVIAVDAIMEHYGKMSDEDFITHVITCCKEAKGLATTPEEEIAELENKIQELKLQLTEKKKKLFNDTNNFKVGEKLLIDQWDNGQWKEGIFLGTTPQSDGIAPIVAKVNKDGTKNKNCFVPTRWTKLKKL